jgi:RNA-directed DNA polymerase
MIGPAEFAWGIGHSPEHLESIGQQIDEYYFQRQIPKAKDVGYLQDFGVKGSDQVIDSDQFRTITESQPPLKAIQQKIQVDHLSNLSWPEHVHGGIKGRSNVTNARSHLGKKHRFVTDIGSFFPSVSYRVVYRAFENHLNFSPDAARLATRLTTFKGSLPQGTATSPLLANLVFLPVDRQLATFCSGHGITYTRFVDDLTFSAPTDFARLTGEIRSIIAESQFQIKGAKTKYRSRPIEITGVVVENNRLRAPDRLKRKLRTLDPASSSFDGLKGYIDFIEEPYQSDSD